MGDKKKYPGMLIYNCETNGTATVVYAVRNGKKH
jgi:hypothetical protein